MQFDVSADRHQPMFVELFAGEQSIGERSLHRMVFEQRRRRIVERRVGTAGCGDAGIAHSGYPRIGVYIHELLRVCARRNCRGGNQYEQCLFHRNRVFSSSCRRSSESPVR